MDRKIQLGILLLVLLSGCGKNATTTGTATTHTTYSAYIKGSAHVAHLPRGNTLSKAVASSGNIHIGSINLDTATLTDVATIDGLDSIQGFEVSADNNVLYGISVANANASYRFFSINLTTLTTTTSDYANGTTPVLAPCVFDGKVVVFYNDSTNSRIGVDVFDTSAGSKSSSGYVGSSTGMISQGYGCDLSTSKAYLIHSDGKLYWYSASDNSKGEISVSGKSFSAISKLNPTGKAILAYWDSSISKEKVISADLSNDSVTNLGNLGDLNTWSNQLTYRESDHQVYAIGSTNASPTTSKIFSLDINDQTNTSFDLATGQNFFFGQFSNAGEVLIAYWDNINSKEKVDTIKMSSGVRTTIGSFGTLKWWSGYFKTNTSLNLTYALGWNSDDSKSGLYFIDLSDGTESSIIF